MILEEPGPVRTSVLKLIGLMALGALVLGLSAFAARTIRDRADAPPRVDSTVAREDLPSPAKRGKLLYQVQCARCHGADGHGDGPDAAELKPPPRDFASTSWRFGPAPELIRKVIVEGIPGTTMYALGGSLSTRELDAVVEHVRSLAPKALETRPSARLEPLLKRSGFAPEDATRSAPAFEVEDLDGARRSIEGGRGRTTLLVFWGTSCAPCLEEMPALERLAVEFQGRGLDVIPVCVDESDRSSVRRAVRGRFERFPAFVSVDGMARLRYDIQTLPVAALIDRKGNVLGISRGGIDWQGDAARSLIDGCLAEFRTK